MAPYIDYESKSNFIVWKRLLREEKGQIVMCKYTDCKKILQIKGGSTKGPYMHLLSAHKINLTTATTSARRPEPPTKESKTLTNISDT